MFSINLVNVTECCSGPMQYNLVICADFETAYFIRQSLPKYIYDKNYNVVISTIVYGDCQLLSDSDASTSNDFRVTYLYDVTPANSCSLVYKVGVSSSNDAIATFLNSYLPTCITSDDGSLTLKVFQYCPINNNSNKVSNYNGYGCGGCGYGGCGCGYGGCGGCGCGYGCGCDFWLWGGLALLALCFC